MRTQLLIFAAVAALAYGCRASIPDAPEATAGAGGGSESAEAAAVDAAMKRADGARYDYRISPADLVNVTIFEAPDMNRKARVNASGMIFLPLVGPLKVAGKTLGEAQAFIEERLKNYVVRPQVTLFVEEYANKVFFVSGEVQKPGSYPIPSETRVTVLEAISTAGGFTPIAAQDRARVLRRVNGESRKFTIDVRSARRGGDKSKDMVLEPNDVVFIPQRFF